MQDTNKKKSKKIDFRELIINAVLGTLATEGVAHAVLTAFGIGEISLTALRVAIAVTLAGAGVGLLIYAFTGERHSPRQDKRLPHLGIGTVALVLSVVLGYLLLTAHLSPPLCRNVRYVDEFESTACWRVRTEVEGDKNTQLGVELSTASLSGRLCAGAGLCTWNEALKFEVNLPNNLSPGPSQKDVAQLDSLVHQPDCPGQWFIPTNGRIQAQIYLPDDAPDGLVLQAQYFLFFTQNNEPEWHFSSPAVRVEPGQVVPFAWDSNSETWRDWEIKIHNDAVNHLLGIEFKIAEESAVDRYSGAVYIDEIIVTTDLGPPRSPNCPRLSSVNQE
jgi:hypothetical protein